MIAINIGTAGLVDVGYRFYNAVGVATGARVTSGIVDEGDGYYSANVDPAITDYSVRWDSTGTPAAKGREYFERSVKWTSAAIINPSGTAVTITSTGGTGVYVTGDVYGLLCYSAAGYGFASISGQGSVISANTPGSSALTISGMDGSGLTIAGTGAPGLYITADTGDAAQIVAQAGNGDALQLTPHGTGAGISGTITGPLLTGAITSTSFATSSITSATLALDCITSNQLAASATAEMADAVWDEALLGHLTAGTAGKALSDATGGSGAHPITVTVTDFTDPLQNAAVRVTLGVTSHVLMTDASGNATFSLDAGTYTVSITKSGYTFAATTRTVTGNETGSLTNQLEMTATTTSIPSPPADVSLCRLYGYLELPDGKPAKNHKFEITLEVPGGTGVKSDGVITGRKIVVKTNEAGEIISTDTTGSIVEYVELQRNDLMTPSTSVYRIDAPQLGFNNLSMTLTAGTKDIASLIT